MLLNQQSCHFLPADTTASECWSINLPLQSFVLQITLCVLVWPHCNLGTRSRRVMQSPDRLINHSRHQTNPPMPQLIDKSIYYSIHTHTWPLIRQHVHVHMCSHVPPPTDLFKKLVRRCLQYLSPDTSMPPRCLHQHKKTQMHVNKHRCR